MTRDLKEAYSIANLKRAWRWLRTNREALFKNYVRHIDRAYAMCIEDNLSDLHERLKNRLYTPNHTTKLLFPKKTGILRPFSLLTIEDHIVYQALANVIAEALLPGVRKR